MKKILFLYGIFWITACSNDDSGNSAPLESDDKQITNFVFLASDNDALSEDVTLPINQQNNIIFGELPFDTDVTALVPTITISEKANINPNNKIPQNFTNALTYMVTAEDGSTQEYTVTMSIAPNTEKQILDFKFLKDYNTALSEDIVAAIDQDSKTIVAYVPAETDLTKLTPTIALSDKATVNPVSGATHNFISSTLTYTVTADDNSTQEYYISVIIKEPTDRQVLERLYKANPNSTLDWDLAATDISNWSGVTSDADQKVTSLELYFGDVSFIPREIGDLDKLETLRIEYTGITGIPKEIGKLVKLTFLSLNANTIVSDIPKEIGNLVNLEVFNAPICRIVNLPKEIGKLKNLTYLNLSDNSLINIPSEIGKLKNLKTLSLTANPLTSLPADIGNLNNLEIFYVSETSLSSIPIEIKNINNPGLKRISLTNNPNLTEIPIEICALADDNTEVLKDDGVACN